MKRQPRNQASQEIVREWSDKFLRAEKAYVDALRAEIRRLVWAQKCPQEIFEALMEKDQGRLYQHDLEELIGEVWVLELKKLGSN